VGADVDVDTGAIVRSGGQGAGEGESDTGTPGGCYTHSNLLNPNPDTLLW
jgi:hypothetical protein